jgi:hypothetical protein
MDTGYAYCLLDAVQEADHFPAVYRSVTKIMVLLLCYPDFQHLIQAS